LPLSKNQIIKGVENMMTHMKNLERKNGLEETLGGTNKERSKKVEYKTFFIIK